MGVLFSSLLLGARYRAASGTTVPKGPNPQRSERGEAPVVQGPIIPSSKYIARLTLNEDQNTKSTPPAKARLGQRPPGRGQRTREFGSRRNTAAQVSTFSLLLLGLSATATRHTGRDPVLSHYRAVAGTVVQEPQLPTRTRHRTLTTIDAIRAEGTPSVSNWLVALDFADLADAIWRSTCPATA